MIAVRSPIQDMSVSADSSLLVVGGETIEFFSRSEQDITGLGVIEYTPLSVGKPVAPIQSVSVSPNGHFVASSSRHSPIVTVFLESSSHLDLVFGQGCSPSFRLFVSLVLSRFADFLVPDIVVSITFHSCRSRCEQLRLPLRAVSRLFFSALPAP